MSPPGLRPLVIGHRGDSAACPENTRAAFAAALAGGADGIELDLRPTRDGQVVVCHDASLARVGGSHRSLARQELAALQQVDVGSWRDARFRDERLLSLDELLAEFPNTQLLLELKAAAGIGAKARNRRLCRDTVAAIARHRAAARVYILCFSATVLAAVAALAPRLRLVRNCSKPPRDLGPWLQRQPALTALDVDRRHLTRRLVEDCHARGLQIFSWSCNTPAHYAALRELGSDGILSDRPGWLRQQVDADA